MRILNSHTICIRESMCFRIIMVSQVLWVSPKPVEPKALHIDPYTFRLTSKVNTNFSCVSDTWGWCHTHLLPPPRLGYLPTLIAEPFSRRLNVSALEFWKRHRNERPADWPGFPRHTCYSPKTQRRFIIYPFASLTGFLQRSCGA